MLCNIALWDRFLRLVLAIGVLSYAVAGGPLWFWLLGIYALLTASWGLCPIYSFFRIKTLR